MSVNERTLEKQVFDSISSCPHSMPRNAHAPDGGKQATSPTKVLASDEEEGNGDDPLCVRSEKRGSETDTSCKKKTRFHLNSPELALDVDGIADAGQFAANTTQTDLAKVEAKREYNRRNAARARVRNKSMVGELHQKCTALQQRTENLERENQVLRAQLDIFRNHAPLPPSSNGSMSELLKLLAGTTTAGNPLQPPLEGSLPMLQRAMLEQQFLSNHMLAPHQQEQPAAGLDLLSRLVLQQQPNSTTTNDQLLNALLNRNC
jgi:hypothetical protein